MKTTVTLSHREFTEAAEEIAKRTGRPLGAVAESLAASVRVEAPPPDLSKFRLNDYASAIAQATAEHGCSVSQAIQIVNVRDFDGQ